jgi:hypothetical protein
MIARFGNVSVSQFEERTGVTLNDEDRKWFEQHRQDIADVTDPNKLHIFDKPFGIHCGENIVHETIKRLQAYGAENFKERLAVYD